jgi:hypothetical protein
MGLLLGRQHGGCPGSREVGVSSGGKASVKSIAQDEDFEVEL